MFFGRYLEGKREGEKERMDFVLFGSRFLER